MNKVSKTDCASIIRVNIRAVTMEMKTVPIMLTCLNLPHTDVRKTIFCVEDLVKFRKIEILGAFLLCTCIKKQFTEQ